MKTFSHAGDLGDLIASLPTVRALGGGHYVICERTRPLHEGGGRESMKGARFDAIKPLLEAQSFIRSVTWREKPSDAATFFSDFRQGYRVGRSLVDSQAEHLGVTNPDTSPWLTAVPNRDYLKRVIFARSPRYPNGFFPWFALLRRYRDALFVGTREEHTAFEREFNARVEYLPTGNLLALAEVLAGARLFCGNQSCPWWIACGLGVTTFQETWTHDPNSVIERPNAFYMIENKFDLERLPA